MNAHDLPPIDVDESVRKFVAFGRKRAAIMKEQLDVQAQIEALNKRSDELIVSLRMVSIDYHMQKTTIDMLLAQEAGHPTVDNAT